MTLLVICLTHSDAQAQPARPRQSFCRGFGAVADRVGRNLYVTVFNSICDRATTPGISIAIVS